MRNERRSTFFQIFSFRMFKWLRRTDLISSCRNLFGHFFVVWKNRDVINDFLGPGFLNWRHERFIEGSCEKLVGNEIDTCNGKFFVFTMLWDKNRDF